MKNLRKTKRRIILLISACFLLVAFAADCRAIEIDSFIEGFELEEYNGEQRVMTVTAEKAYLANRRIGFFQVAWDKVVYLENVDIDFYDKEGNFSFNIETDMAIFDPENKRFLDLNGNVIDKNYTSDK
jgi:hypothetical protein